MNIVDILETVLYAVITTAIPIIAAYITKFLSAKKQQIIADINNEKLKNYIAAAIDAVNSAVLMVSQTYVDALKGTEKWDESAMLEAKSKAVETATALITDDAKKAIVRLYGDFDKWLDYTIEKYVKINKVKED